MYFSFKSNKVLNDVPTRSAIMKISGIARVLRQ